MSKRQDTQLLKLLTPELKAKVEQKTKECFAAAAKHFKTEFPDLEIRYDIKNWTGGIAYRGRNLVRYNLILLVENEKHFIENIVPHEVAHIVVNKTARLEPGDKRKRIMPHGKEWKFVMTEIFKVPANPKHTYDCSSIEKNSKRKSSRRARVENALNVISSVVRRANKKFTPEELARFHREVFNIFSVFGSNHEREAA